VWPQLGYIRVMDASTINGAPLSGVSTTVYPVGGCAPCTIGQAAYAWTQYP
jgi:hypothetical protein